VTGQEPRVYLAASWDCWDLGCMSRVAHGAEYELG
jgi:hypothetical protein